MIEYLAEVMRHGYSRYRAGCRCAECRQAARTTWKRQKQRQRATDPANPAIT